VRIGVTLPTSDADGIGVTPRWPGILAFARMAEQLGFDSVWLPDHLVFRLAPEPVSGLHEAWTILSALAATTARVALGPLVLCHTFRNPGLVAKMAVAADEVSDGRFVLGVGTGWHEPEYHAFGYPFDHRVARFEEGLRIIRPLLGGESVTFTGRYHAVREAILLPPPARRVPLLIAARGPRMLRLTARHADAWNGAWYGLPDDRLRASLRSLDEALVAERRDPATLTRTVGMVVRDPELTTAQGSHPAAYSGTVDDVARALDEHAALGTDELIVWLQPKTERSLARLNEAVQLHRGTDRG
jgi:probable F420-dependent oxidoreductase